jgi:hypothetical protein
MSGKALKSLFLAGGLISCVALTVVVLRKKNVNKKSLPPTVDQYFNRLEEFCVNDLSIAQEEFWEFIDMGLTARDAFELTIIKRVYV